MNPEEDLAGNDSITNMDLANSKVKQTYPSGYAGAIEVSAITEAGQITNKSNTGY
jgi:hypothetical protein